MIKVIESFNISDEGVRVALIVFSTQVSIEFSFPKHTTIEELIKGVNDVKYKEGGTDTAAGLLNLKRVMASDGRDKHQVPRVAVVLTDGR